MEQQMKIIADAVNEIMRQTLADRDEIERLRKQLKQAVSSDTEYCKVLEADNARLREALQKIAAVDDERLPAPSTPEEGVLWSTLDACVGLARKATGGE